VSRKLHHLRLRMPLRLRLRRLAQRSKLLPWMSPLAFLLALCFSVSFSWQVVLRYSSSSSVWRGSTKCLELANTDTVAWVIWISSSERYLQRSAYILYLLIYGVLPRSFNQLCIVRIKVYDNPPKQTTLSKPQHRARKQCDEYHGGTRGY
jgi:hypothetical protein